MNVRKTKKHPKIMCAHNKSYRFLVTDDPFPCYDTVFICSMKKIHQYSASTEEMCDKCKKYFVSKKRISEDYKINKERRKWIKQGI